VHRYMIENAIGLSTEVEAGARLGRPEVSDKRWLLDRWDRAFLIGHGEAKLSVDPPSPRRYALERASFLRLCAAPAALNLSDVGGDWWDDLRRKKHRANRET
jgi:hypothetical protein